MTIEEYTLWVAGNDKLLLMFRAASPCRDCTPLWHKDMVAGGMCDGEPLEGQRAPSQRYGSYADLQEYRRQFPKHGAPRGLSEALTRARMREYRRRLRSNMPV
jgi:hypothetical protein